LASKLGAEVVEIPLGKIIKEVFNRIRSENPYWSDYICFAEAVRGRKFSRKTII
jgi:hypothetical protein